MGVGPSQVWPAKVRPQEVIKIDELWAGRGGAAGAVSEILATSVTEHPLPNEVRVERSRPIPTLNSRRAAAEAEEARFFRRARGGSEGRDEFTPRGATAAAKEVAVLEQGIEEELDPSRISANRT